MTTTAKPSAKIIPLPGAAPEPVRQPPRRGRFPAIVTQIRRGYLIKLEASTRAAAVPSKGDEAQKILEEAQSFYLTVKRLHDSTLSDLLVARQRAGLEGQA
jgi:hypothetical protein